MARALSAAGLDAVPREQRPDAICWREELAAHVIALQRPDGSWQNDNNRWWENDPVLATSSTLVALEMAAGLTR